MVSVYVCAYVQASFWWSSQASDWCLHFCASYCTLKWYLYQNVWWVASCVTQVVYPVNHFFCGLLLTQISKLSKRIGLHSTASNAKVQKRRMDNAHCTILFIEINFCLYLKGQSGEDGRDSNSGRLKYHCTIMSKQTAPKCHFYCCTLWFILVHTAKLKACGFIFL